MSMDALREIQGTIVNEANKQARWQIMAAAEQLGSAAQVRDDKGAGEQMAGMDKLQELVASIVQSASMERLQELAASMGMKTDTNEVDDVDVGQEQKASCETPQTVESIVHQTGGRDGLHELQ